MQEINENDQLSTTIRIFSYPIDNDISLSEEVNQTVSYYEFASTYYQYQPGFELVNVERINLTDLSAVTYQLDYHYTDLDELVMTREIIFMTNDRVYSISYSAQREEFFHYLPILDEMINSDSFEMFKVSQYEMSGTDSSGIILRYPEKGYPCEINEIDDKNVNFMRKNLP